MEFAMIDKKPHIKPYLYGMLAGFGAISLSIIFFFLIYRFDGFGDAISTLTGILMPFIYGAVIAYLLKPVCNTIETFLRRFIPEKMKGLINALSVTFTILFGLLLIYALCMMIIPQLITSVTTRTTPRRPILQSSCTGQTIWSSLRRTSRSWNCSVRLTPP